jgi:F-type H+-transporting ATPase subunit alpha
MSVMQQGQSQPSSLAEEVLLLYALNRDLLTSLPAADREKFRKEILAFARERDAALLQAIEERRTMTPDIESGLERVMAAFFSALG